MAVTARDIIQDAMEKLGVYAPGETMNAADAKRGLIVLNDMLESWSNESLSCYTILEQSTILTPGVSQYTIGAGATLDMTRPIRLITGPGAAYMQDDNGNNYGMDVVPRDQWNLLGTRQITSDVPDTLFYDPQFPWGVLNFYPIPIIGWTAFWDSYLQLSDVSTLETPISLPPGYNLALKSNLCLFLQPYFTNAQVSVLLLKQASDAKGNIKRANQRMNVAVYDPEIVSHATATYNFFTDSSSSGGRW